MNTVEALECPNRKAIVAFCQQRGLQDVQISHHGTFGWNLSAISTAAVATEDRLSQVCSDIGILRGGGTMLGGRTSHQIDPASFHLPIPPPGPKALLGYLGCPVAGDRLNLRKHPGSGAPAVDLVMFSTSSEVWRDEAVEHFKRLGYLTWIAGSNDAGPGAACFLPRIDLSGNYDSMGDYLNAEVIESLTTVVASKSPLRQRAIEAVLAVDILTNPADREIVHRMIQSLLLRRIAPAEAAKEIARLHRRHRFAAFGSALARLAGP